MQDENVIKKLCSVYNIKLKQIDSYSWDEVGYVLNAMGRVEVLNLQAMEIKKIPEYINDLSELKILHLVGNELESILEIGNLKKLEVLVLQHNKIKNISVVNGFILLKTLNLYLNPIQDIEPLIGLDNLEELYLQNEKVVNCAPIGSLINLQNLRLGINELQESSFLLNCKKLDTLDICGSFKKMRKINYRSKFIIILKNYI